MDPDAIHAHSGIVDEAGALSSALPPAAARYQTAMLEALDRSTTAIAFLRTMVEHHPDAAGTIQMAAADVMALLNSAGEALAGMQTAATCSGEA